MKYLLPIIGIAAGAYCAATHNWIALIMHVAGFTIGYIAGWRKVIEILKKDEA